VHADRLGAQHDSCRLETDPHGGCHSWGRPADGRGQHGGGQPGGAGGAHGGPYLSHPGIYGNTRRRQRYLDCRCVGGRGQCPSCGNPGTLILHWDGTSWSMVPSPDPGPKGNLLSAVAAVSPSDAWAVGTYANSMCSEAATVILRWNGTKWSQVKSPNSGACNFLDGINAMRSTRSTVIRSPSTTYMIRYGPTRNRYISPQRNESTGNGSPSRASTAATTAVIPLVSARTGMLL